METEAAEREATADVTLDRTLVVSPLVDPTELRGGRGNLLAGKVIGYLPVPPHQEQLVDECVADLTYQCTIDRLDVVKVASISEAARKQLRYALIQLDALRTADLGFEVEAVVGRTTQKVEVPARDPLTVRIELDDGNVIQLLQQPGTPDQETGRTGGFFSSDDLAWQVRRRWTAGRSPSHRPRSEIPGGTGPMTFTFDHNPHPHGLVGEIASDGSVSGSTGLPNFPFVTEPMQGLSRGVSTPILCDAPCGPDLHAPRVRPDRPVARRGMCRTCRYLQGGPLRAGTQVTPTMLLIAMCVIACLILAACGTTTIRPTTTTREPKVTTAPGWILGIAAFEALKSEPGARTLFDNPRTFVIGATNADLAGWRCTPVAKFDSYASLHTASLPLGVTYVMYDNEDWQQTPVAEQLNPALYEQAAGTFLHSRQLRYIATPAADLTRVLDKGAPNEFAGYIALDLSGGAARSADVLNIQAQGLEGTPSAYRSFLATTVAQAKAVNPHIVVYAGISTARSSVPGAMFAAVQASRRLVAGYWLNVNTSNGRQASALATADAFVAAEAKALG
ncbi:MAG: hypothetical protein ACYCSF_09900 [Acidimicrobiales bacterium]